jgi:excisionase family DNA binding protein
MTQPATDAEDPRMRTAAEVCAQLRIGKTKFYELINSGELTAHDVSGGAPKGPRRVGEKGRRRSLRVPQSDIDAFLARSRVTT